MGYGAGFVQNGAVRSPEHRLRLAAILAADAVAYSRLMSADARGTIEALEVARRSFQTISVANGGRVVDTAGDSVLAIFQTAAGATAAALAIQHELETRANAIAEDRRLRFRVGLHLGDVVQKADGSVYGDGVNVAARLQSAAPAGGIVASESIRLAVRGKVAARFDDLGDHSLKNIAEPVRAHRVFATGPDQDVHRPPDASATSSQRSWPWPFDRRNVVLMSAAVLASTMALAAYFGLSARPTSSNEPSSANAPSAPLSILVLPFANQTGDEKKAYIADALTLSITADLSRVRDAFVVPATTAFTYRAKGLTVQQVAKDAAVRFVLDGSVMASGQDVRVTAQLMDSKTGAQLWNETFRGDLSNLFALQDQVTTLVGNSIGERMLIVAARESETRKSAPQVVDLMLRARALSLRPQSSENFREVERLFREALSLEPNNVIAMVRLASTLAVHATLLDRSDPARGKQITDARDLALRVKAIDPSLVFEGPLSIYALEHNDFDGARRALEAALAKEPKNPAVYNNLALFYRQIGEPERAMPLLKQALSLYPKGRETIFANLGSASLELGNNDAAIDWLLKTVDLNTEHLEVYSGLAMAYSNKGDQRNAARYVAEYQKRASAQGVKGIKSNAPSPESPPAFLKYYHERFLPQWKKAGLP